MNSFTHSSTLPFEASRVFDWHLQPGAINRLIPTRDNVVVEDYEGLFEGSRATLRLKAGPFVKRWVAYHTDFDPGVAFTDVQESGPFKYWKHRHSVEPAGDSSSVYSDQIEFTLPLHPVSSVATALVKNQLKALFEYRHRIVLNDLRLHSRYGSEPQRFAVTGASGSIGSQLVPFLRSGGHEVQTLVRRQPKSEGEVYWNPATNEIDSGSLEGVDVVIHLAGASILRPWTTSGKSLLYNSRIDGTKLISNTLAKLENKPHTFVSASAIGIYGDQGAQSIDEGFPTTRETFLGDLCVDWEGATRSAVEAGIRTVFPRIGVVISGRGGALDLVAKQFKFGLGGVPGSPDNYVSWISVDDVVGSLYHVSMTPSVIGPVNISAPEPVDWRTLAQTLGRVMRRPSFWRMPAGVLRALGGQFAREVILSSARVVPKTLHDSGYEFLLPNLDDTIRHQLGYS